MDKSGWNLIQRFFKKHHDTRYYGDGGTIHRTGHLDVEVDKNGTVVAVWFRCQPLPFKQTNVGDSRASDMNRMYSDYTTELHGVEVKDPKDPKESTNDA